MRTINVSISEIEFNKFGLKSNKFSFSDLIGIISNELTKQRLNESIELAEKHGLSKMTMDDISKEIKSVRKNAKKS